METTKVKGPSVIQIRTQDVFPQALADKMIQIFHQYEDMLEKGALITVDEDKSKVRILPFS